MELVDNMIRAWNKNELVACADVSTVLTAHISERGELYEQY